MNPGAPGGMETYRQSLTLSFFFKFYLNVLEDIDVQVSPLDRSAYATVDHKAFQSAQCYQVRILSKKTCPDIMCVKICVHMCISIALKITLKIRVTLKIEKSKDMSNAEILSVSFSFSGIMRTNILDNNC